MKSQEFKLTGNFVNDGFRLAELNRSIGLELERLSQAFSDTGNDKVSKQLFDIAFECQSYGEVLKDLIADKTSYDLKEAQKMSGAVLTACLAKANTTHQ